MMLRLRALLTVVLLLGALSSFAARNNPIGTGEFFPDIPLEKPLGADASSYLGVPENVGFTLSHVQADLVLVEFLSVYCPHCQMQVEYYNQLHSLIEKDPATRGRIKVLGIAVASQAPEVGRFIERFGVAYPIVPDPNFQLYHAIGVGVTPFSVYVRRMAHGQAGVVAGTHTGLNKEPEKLYAELLAFADTLPNELQGLEKERATAKAVAAVISDDQLKNKLLAAFARIGGAITVFTPLELPSGRKVFMADTLKGDKQKRLFAEVAARHSICDVCHDVHFLYVFDAKGNILGFEPIQLTKWGNKTWTANDISKMRRRLVGSNLAAPPAFNAEVDAVTSATITSAVIFDVVGQGPALLQELSEKDNLKD